MALAQRPQLSVHPDEELLFEIGAPYDPDDIREDLIETIQRLLDGGILGHGEGNVILRHVVAATTVSDVTRLIEDAFSPRALNEMTRFLRNG